MAVIYAPRHVILGAGALQQVPKQLAILQVEQAFVLYSEGAIGQHVGALQQMLPRASIVAMEKGEPTLQMLERAYTQFMRAGCDGIVAIGGGSVIDLAKALAAKLTAPEQEFMAFAQVPTIARVPFVAVPTTAGTGSEATKVTVIIDEEKGRKLNPAHPHLLPDVVILDAALTVQLPKMVTAYTALDALTHAIEAYVSTEATTMSDFYALEAIRLITAHIITVQHEPNNLAIREALLVGSYYAGIAFSNASTNLAHATGRALGTMLHLPHGQSVALMHPFVVAYSMEAARERYATIARVIGLVSAEQVVHYLYELNEQLHVWQEAKCYTDEIEVLIPQLTASSLSGNGIATNRQIPTAEDIAHIFQQLVKYLQAEGAMK